MLTEIMYIFRTLKPREFRIRPGTCVLCGPTLFLKLFDGGFGVRCIRCGAATNTQALVAAIKYYTGDLGRCAVQVTSAGGPYLTWLTQNAGVLQQSQFLDDVEPGTCKDGIRCEDLQRLTYDDESFDIVTNEEVLEHVIDDRKAFSEIHRVLRPGGRFIFTVPLSTGSAVTVERALVRNDRIVHLLPPELHDDPMRGKILAFRNYAYDIKDRLTSSGFCSAEIFKPEDPAGFGRHCPVVVALKAPLATSDATVESCCTFTARRLAGP